MTHTYKVSGMTCEGCRKGVEKKLRDVPGVTQVDVNLEKEEAVISMNSHITTNILQEALPEKYDISEKAPLKNVFNYTAKYSEDVNASKLQQLKPLIIILIYISIATLLLNYKDFNWRDTMLDFMGLFFIVFSFFKILDLKGFPESFRMYDPLAKTLPIYGWIYPFLETALGLMLLMRFQIPIALIITLLVLSITTIGVTKTLLDKKSIQCACLGTALKLPMTEATFIENTIMIVMAIIMLIHYL